MWPETLHQAPFNGLSPVLPTRPLKDRQCLEYPTYQRTLTNTGWVFPTCFEDQIRSLMRACFGFSGYRVQTPHPSSAQHTGALPRGRGPTPPGTAVAELWEHNMTVKWMELGGGAGRHTSSVL